MLKGSLVALITPFRGGAIDEKAFQDFVDWQIEQGTEGVVPCGTTGESPTLSHAEHKRVVELCVEVAKGRVPVVAGTGSNSTAEAIDFTRHAKQAGADAALVVTPYYNKPTQEGLYQHYKAIAEAVDLPIIIYNIPARCVIDMSVATMVRLAKLPNIVGVRTRPTISPGRCAPARRSAPTSRWSRARMSPQSLSWGRVATAASRSRRMLRRALAPTCTKPGVGARRPRR